MSMHYIEREVGQQLTFLVWNLNFESLMKKRVLNMMESQKHENWILPLILFKIVALICL